MFELNKLADCRREWGETLKVRKELLKPDDLGMAAIYHNFGNLELGSGNGYEAAEYYEQAMELWKAGGDEAAIPLALTYLCLGRTKMYEGDLNEALKHTTMAESLFLRTIGAEKGFMIK